MMQRRYHEKSAPDARVDLARIQTGALIIIAFAVVLFLLVQARFMLVSLASAIVLFSLTSSVINFIGRQRIGPFRVPNWLASLAALGFIAVILLSASAVLLNQINTVLGVTLEYAERAPKALASLFGFMGERTETSVLNALQSVDVASYVRSAAGRASAVTQAVVLVILFVGFLFAERIWFNTKLTNFVGDPVQAERVGKIISSIILRVNYYLLVKTVVSAMTGAMVFVAAQAFGIELAVALGVITFVLNYIPNVGSIIATGLVALVAHVQLGDPTTTFALFIVSGFIQFLNGNVIDPMLMGRALRLSSFGIVISLAFWGAVWGIPGMFLSVPIMVMLLVVCSHVRALRPIAILLSREGLPETEDMLDVPIERDLFGQEARKRGAAR